MLKKLIIKLLFTTLTLCTNNKNIIIKRKSLANQRQQNQYLAKKVYKGAIATKNTRKALGPANELNIAILHAAMKNIPTTSKFVNTFKELRQIYSARIIQDYTNYMENLQENLKEKMINLPEYKNFKLTHSKIIVNMKKFFARHKLKSFVTFYLRRDDLWGTHFIKWIDFFRLQKYFFGPFKYYILDCYKIKQFKSMCKEFFRDHVPLLDIPFPPQQKVKFIQHFNVETPDNIIDEIEGSKKIEKKDKTEDPQDVIKVDKFKSKDDFRDLNFDKIIKKNVSDGDHSIFNEKNNVDINVSYIDKTVSEEREDSLSSLSSEEEEQINYIEKKSQSFDDKFKINYNPNSFLKKRKTNDEFIKKKLNDRIPNKKINIFDKTTKNNESNLPLILRKDHIKKHLDGMNLQDILLKLKNLTIKNIKKEVDINTVKLPVIKKSDKFIYKDDYLNFFDKELNEEINLPKIKKDEITNKNYYQNFINDNKKNNSIIYDNYLEKAEVPIIKNKVFNTKISKNIYLDNLIKNTNNNNSDIFKNNVNNIKIIKKENFKLPEIKYNPNEIKYIPNEINNPDQTKKNQKINEEIMKLIELQKKKKLISFKKDEDNLSDEKNKFNNLDIKSNSISEEEFSIEEVDKLKIITDKRNNLINLDNNDRLINKKIIIPVSNEDNGLKKKKIIIKKDEKNKNKQFVRIEGNKYLIPKNIKIKKKKNNSKDENDVNLINKKFKDLFTTKIDKFSLKKENEKYLPKKDEIKIENTFVIPKLITKEEDDKKKKEKYETTIKIDESSPKKQETKKYINSSDNTEINKESVIRHINQDYMNKMINRYFVKDKINNLNNREPENRENFYFQKIKKFDNPKNNLVNKNFSIHNDYEKNLNDFEKTQNFNFKKKDIPSILDQINNFEKKNKVVKKKRIITEVIIIELVDCEECMKITYMDIFLNN